MLNNDSNQQNQHMENSNGSATLEYNAPPKNLMEAALKQRSDASTYLKVGDIVEGSVLSREGNKLFLDVGARGIGVVFGKEFYEAQHIIKDLKLGDTVMAKVLELESSIVEGYPELSLKEAGK